MRDAFRNGGLIVETNSQAHGMRKNLLCIYLSLEKTDA